MTLQGLIDLFRSQADDNSVSNPLWDDVLLTARANEAQLEACRRARLLEDATTAAVCQVTVTAGTHTYDVDPRVMFIRRVKLDAQEFPLPKVDVPRLDLHRPGWDGEDGDDPITWMPWGNQQIRLFPTPIAADTLRMIVVREPLADMALAVVSPPTAAVDPEIPRRYHDKLVDWMLYRCLLDRDREERYDPAGAKRHLDMFEQEFGKKSSAIDETWIARRHGYDENEGLF